METMRKKRLKVAGGEQVSEVLIKQDMEGLAEDSHASDLANQEFELNEELSQSMKTEEDPHHTDAEDHTAQWFTPVPQTDECIKTELVLDDFEEFIDILNDSKAKADDPQVRASISDKSETTELSSHSDAPESLRKARKGLTPGERVFKCDLCLCAFIVKQALERHLRTHAKDRKREFACDLCEERFFSNENLKTHKGREHSKRGLKCEFCARTFKNKSSLNRHLHSHAKFKAHFVCEVCGSSYTQKGTLKKHMRGKHFDKAQSITPAPQTTEDDSASTNEILKTPRTSQATFECGICSRSCKSKGNLKRHLQTHSKDRKREFACDLCEKKYYCENSLWAHKKVHTPNSYRCKVCGQRFRLEESLKVHILSRQHYDEMQPFTPESSNDDVGSIKTEQISDEEFIDEGNDREQAALATGDELEARVSVAKQCVTSEVCQDSYPGELIETHIRSGQPYKCEFCPRVCLYKSALNRHLRTHNENRTRPYSCVQCGSKFLQEAHLREHMRTRHTKNRKPEFNCKLCDKKFYAKVGLGRHMRSHTGETVSCEVCGTRFTQKGSLKRHMLSKHLGKAANSIQMSTFICKVCGSSYTRKEYLQRHMVRKHWDKAQSITPGP